MKEKKLTKKEIKKLEKREQNKKDKEWSRLVKERDGQCFICGSTERLQSHHIIPREVKFLRHDVDNGITLCPNHHKFSLESSPHKNPLVFYDDLKKKRPYQIKLLLSLYYLEKYGKEKLKEGKEEKE